MFGIRVQELREWQKCLVLMHLLDNSLNGDTVYCDRSIGEHGCAMGHEEVHYKVLKLVEAQPDMSQRELARELDISLGKANYCLNALIDKGLIKARNFKNNPSKRGYAYILTPRGLEEKAKITARFLKRKMQEYEVLKEEIAQLQKEVERAIGNE